MTDLLTDIFVTVKDRFHLAERSLNSLFDNTDLDQYRLTVCLDGGGRGPESFRRLLDRADYILESRENEGLGPMVNRAVAHIRTGHDYLHDGPRPSSRRHRTMWSTPRTGCRRWPSTFNASGILNISASPPDTSPSNISVTSSPYRRPALGPSSVPTSRPRR